MSVDVEVRRAIWNGAVPIQVCLDEEELTPYVSSSDLHTARSSPFYIMASRCGYLPLLLPQIRRHFSRWIGKSSAGGKLDLSTPWFSHGVDPLNWHYPVGLLHDLALAKGNESSNGTSLRPWTLTIHFNVEAYPTAILPFTDPDLSMTRSMLVEGVDCTGAQMASSMTLQNAFYSSLKQADCLRFGSCKRMMNLSKTAQIQLWDSLWTHNFDRYWKVNDGLVKSTESHGECPKQATLPQRVPLRCYIVDGPDPAALVRILQWPVAFEGTTVLTLIEALKLDPSAIQVLLHGLNLDHTTPLAWLTLNAPYADNFLHLVICKLP